MTQIRLTQDRRQRLSNLASAIVACPGEKAAMEAAYAAAVPLVKKAVEDRFPPRDMKILAKYQASHIDDCIQLRLTAGGVEQFDFDRETGPLTTRVNCTRNIYLADEPTTDAVTTWRMARDKYRAAIKAKLGDYNALIFGATTFEQVTAVWEEAETLRPEMAANAVILLSEDVVARIRADMAQRHAVASNAA